MDNESDFTIGRKQDIFDDSNSDFPMNEVRIRNLMMGSESEETLEIEELCPVISTYLLRESDTEVFS